MVAFLGYQKIVRLYEVTNGMEFASTKTGNHFKFIDGKIVSVDEKDIGEEFNKNDLVYINVPPVGAM